MIRLTTQRVDAHHIVIRVEGRLDCTAISDLETLIESLGSASVVNVDLDGVTSIDDAARACLIGLRRRGCRLRGGSLYISRLIEEAAL